ncbi:MAG: thiamine phosphate synthase [Polyangiaceae bacterium]
MQPRGLYAIADVDLTARAGFEILPFVAALLDARPALLQIRAKHLGARDTLELLERVVPLAKSAGVPVFANDRPDLAWLAGCDGVHVGQSDMSVADVRRFRRELSVGVSTHDEAQLLDALGERPTYVALGPIFGTRSKDNPEPTVGLGMLARAYETTRTAGIPLVAIGGIDDRSAREVREHADYISVISALIPADGALASVTRRAREMHELICGR